MQVTISPDMAGAHQDTASDWEPRWQTRQQQGSSQLFFFRPYFIRTRVTFARALVRSGNGWGTQ